MITREFLVDGKKVHVRVDPQAPILGSGYESKVYPVGRQAFKIYRSYMLEKNNLGEKECLFLSKLSTKRILLPDQPIYDSDKKYCGSTSELLWQGEKEDLLYMHSSVFLENVKLLYEDSMTLTNHQVMLDDLRSDNVMVTENKKIYIIDPGYFNCYSLQEKLVPTNLKEINENFIRKVILLVLYQLLKTKNNEYEVIDYLERFPHKKEEFIFELMEQLNDFPYLKDYRNFILEEINYNKIY